MLAAHSVGAVGGSMGVQVGPESVGADPGPARYGRGGVRLTLTDAAVVLGYLRPSAHVEGGVRIDGNLAQRAFEDLARRLDTPVPRVTRGVVRVANANMARALKRITVDRGVDTRDCALIAFGGAGPMYAVELHAPANGAPGADWDADAFERACAATDDEARESLSRGRGAATAVGVEYAGSCVISARAMRSRFPARRRATGGVPAPP